MKNYLASLVNFDNVTIESAYQNAMNYIFKNIL